MELIIGGAYQGKRAFAVNTLGIPETDIFTCSGTEIDFSKNLSSPASGQGRTPWKS